MIRNRISWPILRLAGHPGGGGAGPGAWHTRAQGACAAVSEVVRLKDVATAGSLGPTTEGKANGTGGGVDWLLRSGRGR